MPSEMTSMPTYENPLPSQTMSQETDLIDSIQMTGQSGKSEKKAKLTDDEKVNLQQKLNGYDENVTIGAHIVIQDSNMLEENEIRDNKADAINILKANPDKVVNYETFESSSEDEFS